jgi:hypothetical protein
VAGAYNVSGVNKSIRIGQFGIISTSSITHPIQAPKIPTTRLRLIIIEPSYPEEIHSLGWAATKSHLSVIYAEDSGIEEGMSGGVVNCVAAKEDVVTS